MNSRTLSLVALVFSTSLLQSADPIDVMPIPGNRLPGIEGKLHELEQRLATLEGRKVGVTPRLNAPISAPLGKALQIVVPSLDFKDASPIEVLRAITAASGIEILYTITATEGRKVTMQVANIPTSEAFTMLSGLSGLKFAYESNRVRFFPGE